MRLIVRAFNCLAVMRGSATGYARNLEEVREAAGARAWRNFTFIGGRGDRQAALALRRHQTSRDFCYVENAIQVNLLLMVTRLFNSQ